MKHTGPWNCYADSKGIHHAAICHCKSEGYAPQSPATPQIPTPTPWGYVYDGSSEWSIGPAEDPQSNPVMNIWSKDDGKAQANAAFIVRAVNAHEELINKLRTASTMLESIANLPEVSNMGGLRTNCNWLSVEIDEAIAKSEEK